ncbi:glycosyltransferase family protein [Pedobacter rhizosphaerae]|uniref:Glycosyltransferase involved in cell wall bisynthesis n=1 Tax=Pedobacter rhizosphaerae TaxID=390241 RepID=A0A1H9N7Q4_9SPHI|nr:hypothetical protein [Pedobacter rhizosphaerae]SER31453.1 Glycosyltransferase involved in cell wall bisynthesis [Pedobacter rhizosphaerae]
MDRIKHIVLITSGQPTTNPRLVKEADSLVKAGYKVTVIYQYLSKWATDKDKALLENSEWRAVESGGNPTTTKRLYHITRLIHKFAYLFAKKVSLRSGIAELAIGRCYFSLLKSAISIKADLYIAHNLAALPIAVKAAKRNKAKVGFDAEDFHRYELSNLLTDFDVRLKTYIEDKYIPQVNYLTSSSPEISKKYTQIFRKEVPVILNVFPKTDQSALTNSERPLKLFWFSQTIGPNRGIETIIEALNLFHFPFELHLLGNEQPGFLASCYTKAIFSHSQIYIHKPIVQSDISHFSSNFDIGLATETGFSINNELALSNKIFTYIQSGLAIIASDTVAQEYLLNEHPNIGLLFRKKNVISLLKAFEKYHDNRILLNKHKTNSFELGQQALNWNVEQQKFLSIIKLTLKD